MAVWEQGLVDIDREMFAGDGRAVLVLCDTLLAREPESARFTAQVMRARVVALGMLGRDAELDGQMEVLQARFACASDPVARFAASQALIDRALHLLLTREWDRALSDGDEALRRFIEESDVWAARALAGELLGAARHLIWSDPLMTGRPLSWLMALSGRATRSTLWTLGNRLPTSAGRPLQRWLNAQSNPRLVQAERITDAVLLRSGSDFSLFAHGLLRRFTVLVQLGRLRPAIRVLAAFRQLGEPAIACVVDHAALSPSGGYRDIHHLAAAIAESSELPGVRSEATIAALRRIAADEHQHPLTLAIRRWKA